VTKITSLYSVCR